jgi:hypothetical protein
MKVPRGTMGGEREINEVTRNVTKEMLRAVVCRKMDAEI